MKTAATVTLGAAALLLLIAKAVLAGYLFYVQAWVPVQVLLLLSAGYTYVVYNNFKLIRNK